MDLLFLLLIILLMFIQIFNTISNVYLMKIVIQLSQENRQLKNRILYLDKRVKLEQWTQLKLLRVLRSHLLGE